MPVHILLELRKSAVALATLSSTYFLFDTSVFTVGVLFTVNSSPFALVYLPHGVLFNELNSTVPSELYTLAKDV